MFPRCKDKTDYKAICKELVLELKQKGFLLDIGEMRQLDLYINSCIQTSKFDKYKLFDVIVTYHLFIVSHINSRTKELIENLKRENESLNDRIDSLIQAQALQKHNEFDCIDMKTYNTPFFTPSEGKKLGIAYANIL